jgi:hypothetical protein
MLEGALIALSLPLLMSSVPLMSLAVIAAIAVLVYEVRGFFGRSTADTPLSETTTGSGTSVPPDRLRAPTTEAVDRVAVLRARAAHVSEPEAAPPAAPLRAPVDPVERPSDEERIADEDPPEPPQAPVVAPPREHGHAGDRKVDGKLAVAGAIVVGLALLWLAVRVARRRADSL